jgi:hypothetical protein
MKNKKLNRFNKNEIESKYLDLIEKRNECEFGSKSYLNVENKIEKFESFYSEQVFGDTNHSFTECLENFDDDDDRVKGNHITF